MNRIFFANKGHTKRAKIQNIWPVKYVAYTPISFFQEPGLTMYINPQLKNLEYFACEFEIFENFGTSETENNNYNGHKYVQLNSVLGGVYNRGFLTLRAYLSGFDQKSAQEREHIVHLGQEAFKLMNEGLAEFEQYFARR
jgi:hypothetical protein